MTPAPELEAPIDEEASQLFERFKAHFPEAYRNDKWYLALIGALLGCNKAQLCGDLYSYLLREPKYATSEQRVALVRRMREALVKLIIISGIPTSMVAVLSIAERERAEDRDTARGPDSRVRRDWAPDEAHERRALDLLYSLYGDDFEAIMARFEAHPDVEWISTHISYGFFLSEMRVLDLVETEFVVMPAIMCQGLAGPAMWHLRCCIKAGIPREDVEKLHQCVEMVAKWTGRDLSGIGRVSDVQERMSDL